MITEYYFIISGFKGCQKLQFEKEPQEALLLKVDFTIYWGDFTIYWECMSPHSIQLLSYFVHFMSIKCPGQTYA